MPLYWTPRLLGPAVTSAVCLQPLTAEVRFQSRPVRVGFVVYNVALGQGFSKYFGCYLFTSASCSLIRKKETRIADNSSSVDDNARVHIVAAAVYILNSWGWEILPHPLYSPAAPSGFHLSSKMKKRLRGQISHSTDVHNEVKK